MSKHYCGTPAVKLEIYSIKNVNMKHHTHLRVTKGHLIWWPIFSNKVTVHQTHNWLVAPNIHEETHWHCVSSTTFHPAEMSARHRAGAPRRLAKAPRMPQRDPPNTGRAAPIRSSNDVLVNKSKQESTFKLLCSDHWNPVDIWQPPDWKAGLADCYVAQVSLQTGNCFSSQRWFFQEDCGSSGCWCFRYWNCQDFSGKFSKARTLAKFCRLIAHWSKQNFRMRCLWSWTDPFRQQSFPSVFKKSARQWRQNGSCGQRMLCYNENQDRRLHCWKSRRHCCVQLFQIQAIDCQIHRNSRPGACGQKAFGYRQQRWQVSNSIFRLRVSNNEIESLVHICSLLQ